MQEKEFIGKGGDPLWLKGVEHLPKRISNLLKLNMLLCHQPWVVSENHFKVNCCRADRTLGNQLPDGSDFVLTFWATYLTCTALYSCILFVLYYIIYILFAGIAEKQLIT